MYPELLSAYFDEITIFNPVHNQHLTDHKYL